MIIICEECATAYNLDDGRINGDGSTVRCTKCRHEFVVYPYEGAAEAAAEPETDAGDEDSPGLADARPMPVDIDEESGPADEKLFSLIEDETEPVEEELIPETEGISGDFAAVDLPALEEFEDFDESLLAEEDEPAAAEQPDPDAEMLLEESTIESTDGPTDEPEEDILDLSDIEDLVDCGEFTGAAEDVASEAENEEPLLEMEEGDRREEIDRAGDDGEPEILFEEPVPVEEGVPEIIFGEPAPVEFEGETFQPDDATTAAGQPDSEATAVLDGDATLVIDSQPVIPTAAMPAGERKSRKPLLAAVAAPVVIAVIALALGLSGIRVSDLAGMFKSIPFAGEFLNFGKNDPAGNLRILPLEETVSSKFVDNASSGRLFVIEGRVRNAYNHPRSHIKIVGRLYQDGNRLSKTTRVYCGNILSDAELEAMDEGTISRRLDSHRGENQSNLTIEPGRSIPFMIVFGQLPDNLTEYSIQVDSSSG